MNCWWKGRREGALSYMARRDGVGRGGGLKEGSDCSLARVWAFLTVGGGRHFVLVVVELKEIRSDRSVLNETYDVACAAYAGFVF